MYVERNIHTSLWCIVIYKEAGLCNEIIENHNEYLHIDMHFYSF